MQTWLYFFFLLIIILKLKEYATEFTKNNGSYLQVMTHNLILL